MVRSKITVDSGKCSFLIKMYNIFNKNNEITFCIQEQEYRKLARGLSPDYSGKFLPEWFKKLETSYDHVSEYGLEYKRPTIRSCIGIRNLITNGIIIPMWSDLIIDVHPDKSFAFQFSDSTRTASPHLPAQFGELYNDCTHLKLVCPWVAKLNKSKQYYFTSPFYHVGRSVDFHVCPGFLDFYYSHSLNVNMFFKVKPETYRITIPAGFPIIQLISTEKTLDKIKIESVSNETWQGMAGERDTSFFKSYTKMVNFIKRRNGQ